MDGTACFGTNCPKKESCYRFTCVSELVHYPYRQSYFCVVPIDKETNECKYYWKFEEKK